MRRDVKGTERGPGRLCTLLAIVVLTLATAGCSGDDGDGDGKCRLPSDCPDGYTCAGGECAPLIPEPDVGAPDADLDGGAPPDQGEPDQTVWPDTGADAGPTCQGNKNGQVERDELLFVVPSGVDYTVGSAIAIDLTGTEWDLTADAADDHVEPMTIDAVPAWAASEFPGADYSSLMNKELDTFGIFKVSPTKLQLIGAISGAEGYGRATYDDPVDLMRFPVVAGDSYKTETSATGSWGAVLYLHNVEDYTVDVLAAGVVKLPKLSLDAMLVRTKVEQWPYGNPFLKQTYTIFLFVAECYGTVARIVVDGDPGDELALAAADVQERWRLSGP